VSRFAALFSTGRVQYTVSFPDNPTALALPMNSGLALRGEESTQSTWQSLPVPALVGFQVQPRSLSMYRSEQMAPMPGSIDLVTDEKTGVPWVVNGTDLELRDAILVDVAGDRSTRLGTIAPGARVDARKPAEESRADPGGIWTDPEPFLKMLRNYDWNQTEDAGEMRLVAWSPKLLPGQAIAPAVDRHRALTLVVAHLRLGPPPSPDDPRYDALAHDERNR
jgi:hypothetical protein